MIGWLSGALHDSAFNDYKMGFAIYFSRVLDHFRAKYDFTITAKILTSSLPNFNCQ